MQVELVMSRSMMVKVRPGTTVNRALPRGGVRPKSIPPCSRLGSPGPLWKFTVLPFCVMTTGPLNEPFGVLKQ